MNWLAQLRTIGRGSVRGAALLMVLGIAISLLAAPAHQVSHHEDDDGPQSTHHCPVCSLAKGQVDSPALAGVSLAFELVEFVGPIAEISLPASPSVDLLPPGRAPPGFVIPS